jgi:hypothetical protein
VRLARLWYTIARELASREEFVDLQFWTDASIILLALEGFILMVIPGILFVGLFIGARKLEHKMREVSPRVQGAFHQVNRLTHQGADKITAPVIKASATGAQLRAMGRRTASMFNKDEVRS